MPSQTYRYYCLDATGRLHDAHWFDAANDAEAVARVRATHPDGKCEIWHEERLVAAIAPNATGRMIEDSLRTLTQAREVLRQTAGIVREPYRPS